MVPVLIGSEPEVRRFGEEKRSLGLINLAGQISLMDLYYLQKQAGLFIGIDSFPLQLTEFSGCKAVALFGLYGNFGEQGALCPGGQSRCQLRAMLAPENRVRPGLGLLEAVEAGFDPEGSQKYLPVRGYSSAGRASGLQPEGRRFKSAYLHQLNMHPKGQRAKKYKIRLQF